MKLKKGDQVKILSGKDRGHSGTILRVFTKTGKIIIEGVNLFKKRSRPKKQGEKGEVVNVARPLGVSKVMLICKNCKASTRVGYRLEGNKKVRFCKKCQVAN